jgi:hypothetical protein
MLRRVLFLVALCGCAAVTSAPAGATAPTTQVIPVDYTFSPPGAACGFAITVHVEGTLTTRTFVDANGSVSRVVDTSHLVERWSANGVTLVGRLIQIATTTPLEDGSYTLTLVGVDFRIPVPGTGIATGFVGRIVILVRQNPLSIEVLQSVGNAAEDFNAICEALAPQPA